MITKSIACCKIDEKYCFAVSLCGMLTEKCILGISLSLFSGCFYEICSLQSVSVGGAVNRFKV